jgi:hypothetical protein
VEIRHAREKSLYGKNLTQTVLGGTFDHSA